MIASPRSRPSGLLPFNHANPSGSTACASRQDHLLALTLLSLPLTSCASKMGQKDAQSFYGVRVGTVEDSFSCRFKAAITETIQCSARTVSSSMPDLVEATSASRKQLLSRSTNRRRNRRAVGLVRRNIRVSGESVCARDCVAGLTSACTSTRSTSRRSTLTTAATPRSVANSDSTGFPARNRRRGRCRRPTHPHSCPASQHFLVRMSGHRRGAWPSASQDT